MKAELDKKTMSKLRRHLLAKIRNELVKKCNLDINFSGDYFYKGKVNFQKGKIKSIKVMPDKDVVCGKVIDYVNITRDFIKLYLYYTKIQ